MIGKKTFLKLFVFALLLLLFGFAAATPSEAIVITIENYTKREVSVAFYYYDAEEKAGIVRGWFNTDAGQENKITLDSDEESLYYYAEGGLSVDDGSGPEAAIIDDSFRYDPKKTTLSGKNLQTVEFRKLITDGKAHTLRFFGSATPTPTPPPPITPPPTPPPATNPPPIPPIPIKPPVNPLNPQNPPNPADPNGSYWMLVEVRNNEAEWNKNLEDINKHPTSKQRVDVSPNSVTLTHGYVGNRSIDYPWLVKGAVATGEITWTDPPRWLWPNQEFSLQLSIQMLKCTFNCGPKGHRMGSEWGVVSQLLRFDEKGNASLISYMGTKDGKRSFAVNSANAFQPLSVTVYGKFDSSRKKGERRGVVLINAGGVNVRTTYIYEWM